MELSEQARDEHLSSLHESAVIAPPPPFQQLPLLLPRQGREERNGEKGVEGEPDGADREESGSVPDEDEARVEWMPYVPVGPTGEKEGKVLRTPCFLGKRLWT